LFGVRGSGQCGWFLQIDVNSAGAACKLFQTRFFQRYADRDSSSCLGTGGAGRKAQPALVARNPQSGLLALAPPASGPNDTRGRRPSRCRAATGYKIRPVCRGKRTPFGGRVEGSHPPCPLRMDKNEDGKNGRAGRHTGGRRKTSWCPDRFPAFQSRCWPRRRVFFHRCLLEKGKFVGGAEARLVDYRWYPLRF